MQRTDVEGEREKSHGGNYRRTFVPTVMQKHLSLAELMLHYYMALKCEERRWTILLGVKNGPRMNVENETSNVCIRCT